MTEEQKTFLDNASYVELLRLWRFEKIGSPWFTGDTGKYFETKFREVSESLEHSEKVAASKVVGWD